jgi:pimeloyl-ACP methyl ester carboxylesterase
MDLKNLIDHLELPAGGIVGIGTSLGCAILWSFSELFTTSAFSHTIFVDQTPLQNYTADGSWGPAHGNRGCNSAASLAYLQATLTYAPEAAHKGTIQTCLAYRSHPSPLEHTPAEQIAADENFFLHIAMQGNGIWYGKLMADHTALDWRDSIHQSFGPDSGSKTKVLVVASERSGCFPAAGPLAVVDLVNGGRTENGLATSTTISWGGHWCYWENSQEFNRLVGRFLGQADTEDGAP